MADAIPYASAKTHRASLITADMHFSGLDSVIFI
jgi:hypothetical protein